MEPKNEKEFSFANLYDRILTHMGRNSIPHAVLDLHNRVSNLEEKTSPKKKEIELTRSQKILLLKETGILDKMLEIGLSANGQAKMVALLLGTDESDLRKIIRQATQELSLRTQTNLLPLRDALNKIGLKEYSNKIDAELDGLGAKN
jgi:hypothetical protein